VAPVRRSLNLETPKPERPLIRARSAAPTLPLAMANTTKVLAQQRQSFHTNTNNNHNIHVEDTRQTWPIELLLGRTAKECHFPY
jgi:hypothetical protein